MLAAPGHALSLSAQILFGAKNFVKLESETLKLLHVSLFDRHLVCLYQTAVAQIGQVSEIAANRVWVDDEKVFKEL